MVPSINKSTRGAFAGRPFQTHRRRRPFPPERHVTFAVDTIGGEESLESAMEASAGWRERVKRRAHRPSSLRHVSFRSEDTNTTSKYEASEYAIILSGPGIQEKATDSLIRKFPQMRKLEWQSQLSNTERQFIIATFRIRGPFVKIHFASEAECRRIKNSADAHFLGVEPIYPNIYTPKKKISEVEILPRSPMPSIDEEVVLLFDGLDVQDGNNKFEPQLRPVSDMELDDVPQGFSILPEPQLRPVSDMELDDVPQGFSILPGGQSDIQMGNQNVESEMSVATRLMSRPEEEL